MPFLSSKPPSLPPPVPIPTRDDPAVLASRKKLRFAQQRRKGRGALSIRGGRGVTTDSPLSQPTAGSSGTLG